MKPRLAGLANLCLCLVCAFGLSSALLPAECKKLIRNPTPREQSKSTEFCPAIPYQRIATSTKGLVILISTFQELDDLPYMLRAIEDFLGKGPFVSKHSLLAFLATEYTAAMRVIFANFSHITEVTLSQLKTIAVMDSDDHSHGFKMFLYCRETEYLQDYFRNILPNITACKGQMGGRILYVQAVLRQLQRLKAKVSKDAISELLGENSTASFQVALPWYHWRKIAEVERRERKFKLERLIFAEEYFFRAEKKLKSIMRLLEFVEDKIQLHSVQEIEMYWDCESRTISGKSDAKRRIMDTWATYLQKESEKLDTARARWSKANPVEKGYVRGFAFGLAGISEEVAS